MRLLTFSKENKFKISTLFGFALTSAREGLYQHFLFTYNNHIQVGEGFPNINLVLLEEVFKNY